MKKIKTNKLTVRAPTQALFTLGNLTIEYSMSVADRLEERESMENIVATPQEGDVNLTDFDIGDEVRVTDFPITAVITRIHYNMIWLIYEDGIEGCVAAADIEKA